MIARSLFIAPGSPGHRQSIKAASARRKPVMETLPALRGKNLACWSPLPEYGEPDNCPVAHL